MTLIEFLKSQASQDTPLGDLAKDIMGDKNFPYQRSEEGIISYIEFQTRRYGNEDVFEEMMKAFQEHKSKFIDPLDLEVNYTPLKAEQWSYLKAHFPAHRAITVGEKGNIYKVYGVDLASRKALKFEIYSKRKLNELSIVDLNDIYIGDLTREVSVKEALDSLAATNFDEIRRPTEPNYSEMIDYLNQQVK